MRRVLTALSIVASASVIAGPFGDAAPVADAELAEARGGVTLPNGLDVSIGVAIETWVDGSLALRTMFSTEGGLRVFAGGDTNPPDTSGTVAATDAGTTPGPTVIIDRNGIGTTVTPNFLPSNLRIAVGSGTSSSPGTGGTELGVTPNGAPVPTALGDVRIEQTDNRTMVILAGSTLEVRQLLGAATGVVVANTANDRVIDSVTTVNVELLNASPVIQTAGDLLRIDSIATDALASRNGF